MVRKWLITALISSALMVFRVQSVSASAQAEEFQPQTVEPNLTFSVMSDLHIRSGMTDWGYPFHDAEAEKNLKRALFDLFACDSEQDALVLNGDITATGMHADYEALTQVLASSPHPLRTLYSMGNHEFYSAYRSKSGKTGYVTFPNGETEAGCINRFIDHTDSPSLYYDTWIEGYHFIVLGSEKSVITHPKTGNGAYLSSVQLSWLQDQLDRGVSMRPTFVFLHQPLPFTVAGSGSNSVLQSAQLQQILRHHPEVILFSGHSHRSFFNTDRTVYRNGFTMVNDGAVRSCVDGVGRTVRESQGLYVQVFDDHVVIQERDFVRHAWVHVHVLPIPMLFRLPSKYGLLSPVWPDHAKHHRSVSVVPS